MDYELIEEGENFWHFREDPESIMESFTVTLIHDGTVVLTGDYGVLAFRREYFPKDLKCLIGFPNEKTDIGYFAGKVCRHGCPFKIEDWFVDVAVEELKEHLKDYYADEGCSDKDKHELLEEIKHIEYGGDVGLHEMLEILYKFDNDGDWTDGRIIGVDYTHRFKFYFELLKFWTKTIQKKK